MSRAQKEVEIQALNERFTNDEVMVVTHYSGLTVKELETLRGDLRKEGATFKVTKNSLAKIALKGTKFEGAADLFSGPVGVATSADPGAAKVAHKFAKGNDKLIILGGALGADVLDIKGIEALAKMPSLDELRATIATLIMSPARNLAGALNAPGGKVAGAVKAVADKAE
ncbi:MAG: 50S ribosomal protein L10 [Micavibrio sp. TMED27]|nr:50S ribosomal protein L10 [Micavibrio sp.]OUT90837.1 MAG: 50S ribosomal protein L10 [Micavibrio sp. TMED27]